MLDYTAQSMPDLPDITDQTMSRLQAAMQQAAVAAEEELAATRDRLALQVTALTRLHALSRQLAGVIELRPAMQNILDTLAELHGATAGIVSLHDSHQGTLTETASTGFGWDMLQSFRNIVPGADVGACGRAFHTRLRTIVEDTDTDPLFNGLRDVAREANFRAVHATPILTRQGDILGVLTLYFRNPRRPSQLEMQLADMCAQQAAEVAETCRDQRTLREDGRRKDEFIAILAHELRNPLAPIRNALHVMDLTADPAMHADARAIIQRQVHQMVRLVDDLLDVSRITRGTIDLRLEDTTLGDAINSALETAAPLLKERGHNLRVEMPAAPIHLRADATRLAQVFSNLLNNAAKYTPTGGRIAITALPGERNVIVRVEDNGTGIPADKLEAVFEIFTQADSSISRAQGGLGIGLTLVRKLVELHGGRVTAASPGEGQGSSFTITMPVSRQPDQSKEEASTMNIAANKGDALRVLIVDDNKDSAMTLGWLVEMLGEDYRLAHSGEEALTVAADYAPGLVLMDIGMPGMTGYETCKKMRENPALSHTVYAAQTGWGEEQHRKNSKDAGFDHHLVKPLSMKNLQELLAEIKGPKTAS